MKPDYARLAIRELVRHVSSSHPLEGITYKELAKRIGRLNKHGEPHAHGMGRILSSMGHMLNVVKKELNKPVPCIQSLVVKKSGKLKGLPDDGMREFWSDYPSLSKEDKISRIRAEYVEIIKFENGWNNVLSHIGLTDEIENPAFAGISESDKEIDSIETFYEGTSKDVLQRIYERNPDARRACLEHWGFDCCICGFNFEEYGSLGGGYIHVHHLVPISTYDDEHPIDPVKDLRPVCPNCHAMLHRKSPPYTIEEICELYAKS